MVVFSLFDNRGCITLQSCLLRHTYMLDLLQKAMTATLKNTLYFFQFDLHAEHPILILK